jgi:hypothetical protein
MDQEETQPFSPSLVNPDVNMTKEDLDAQLNELQSIVSRMGIGSSTAGPQPGARATPVPPVATGTNAFDYPTTSSLTRSYVQPR